MKIVKFVDGPLAGKTYACATLGNCNTIQVPVPGHYFPAEDQMHLDNGRLAFGAVDYKTTGIVEHGIEQYACGWNPPETPAVDTLGWQSDAEFLQCVERVDVSTPELTAKFRDWLDHDGTKAGCLKLQQVTP